MIRPLGRGAVGEVFLARDPALDRMVAIKTLSSLDALEDAEQQEARARFFREARSAAALNHPNIVTIFDVGEEQRTPYIAMERLDGTTLDRHARAPHLLPLPKVLELGIHASLALNEAHRAGIVHRDIKPANMVLCTDGTLKVADFGLAKQGTAALTSVHTVLGTPAYMAPEQVAGREVDSRADLFSLGASLFELLSGRRPFAGDTVSSVLYRVVNDPAPRLRSVRPDAPEALDDLLARLMEKSPEARPADGHQVARELKAILESAGGVPADLVLPPPAVEGGDAADRSGASKAAGKAEGGARDRKTASRGRSRAARPALVAVAVVVLLVAAWLAPVWLGLDPLGSARRPVEDWLSGTLGGFGDAIRVTPPLEHVQVITVPEGVPVTVGNGGGDVSLVHGDLVYPRGRREPIVLAAGDACREGQTTVNPGSDPNAVTIETQPRVVRVPVSSDPSGATVKLAGETLDGRTPLEVPLELCREHHLELRVSGRPPRTVELEASESPEPWRAALENVSIEPPPAGTVVLSASPHYPVAVLSARTGKRFGSAGDALTLRPGRVRLLLISPRVLYRHEVSVDVPPGNRREVNVVYPALGRLRVITVPPGAEIQGRPPGSRRWRDLGRSPLSGYRVVAGDVELMVVHPRSGKRATGTVRIRAGEEPTDVRLGRDWTLD